MRYDLHVHTNLSDCAARDAFFEQYLAIAEEKHQTLLGFSDHSWSERIPGATPFYQKQPYSRLKARKEELDAYLQEHPTDVRVLVGAEGEFANFLLGLDEEAAEIADYIIVPHDHVHMKGFVVPDGLNAEQIASYLLKSFEALCKHPKRNLFTALCHPMIPCCHPWEYTNEVYRFLTDRQLEDALIGAKEAGLWIELNLCEFVSVPEAEWKNYEYVRFFRAAKKVGNILYYGSDSHAHKSYKQRIDAAPKVLELLGLTDADFAEAERLILKKTAN